MRSPWGSPPAVKPIARRTCYMCTCSSRPLRDNASRSELYMCFYACTARVLCIETFQINCPILAVVSTLNNEEIVDMRLVIGPTHRNGALCQFGSPRSGWGPKLGIRPSAAYILRAYSLQSTISCYGCWICFSGRYNLGAYHMQNTLSELKSDLQCLATDTQSISVLLTLSCYGHAAPKVDRGGPILLPNKSLRLAMLVSKI